MKRIIIVFAVVVLAALTVSAAGGSSPAAAQQDAFNIMLTVKADTLLDNMHLLSSEMHELIPDDGIIFHSETVTAYEGENVFDVLQREMREAGIHMSARFTPVFNSAYVEAINNLYEFDAGPLSGWIYSVNGEFPKYGASLHILSPGDAIEWLYSLELGWDLYSYWD